MHGEVSTLKPFLTSLCVFFSQPSRVERTMSQNWIRPESEFQHQCKTLGKLLSPSCRRACPIALKSLGGEGYCSSNIQERVPKNLKFQVLVSERAVSAFYLGGDFEK